MNRLILGCANFGKEYRGHLVPKDEQEKIWSYCREVGIDWVDTAVAYGDIEIPDDFKVITKISEQHPIPPKRDYDILLLHNIKDWYWLAKFVYPSSVLQEGRGISIYNPSDLLGIPIWEKMIIQLPYNIESAGLWSGQGWLKKLKEKDVEIHGRSVFAGGGLLNLHTMKECLECVWKEKDIDKIVVGVENCEQLKQIVEIVNELG